MAQTLGTSFTGATLADENAVPPDSMGTVGPAQYLVAVNNRIRTFSKATGVADGVLDISSDVFFDSVRYPGHLPRPIRAFGTTVSRDDGLST